MKRKSITRHVSVYLKNN